MERYYFGQFGGDGAKKRMAIAVEVSFFEIKGLVFTNAKFSLNIVQYLNTE